MINISAKLVSVGMIRMMHNFRSFVMETQVASHFSFVVPISLHLWIQLEIQCLSHIKMVFVFNVKLKKIPKTKTDQTNQ